MKLPLEAYYGLILSILFTTSTIFATTYLSESSETMRVNFVYALFTIPYILYIGAVYHRRRIDKTMKPIAVQIFVTLWSIAFLITFTLLLGLMFLINIVDSQILSANIITTVSLFEYLLKSLVFAAITVFVHDQILKWRSMSN
jgi:hypothetical protein